MGEIKQKNLLSNFHLILYANKKPWISIKRLTNEYLYMLN